MCSIEANICKAIQLAIDNSEMASKTFLLHIAYCFFEINDHSKTTVKAFSNICNLPTYFYSTYPAVVTFLFIPPRSVVTPRQSRFCLFLPRPLPHLRGQLWPRVCQSRFSFRNIEIKKYRNIEIQNYRNIEIQNCILARRSSLGPPPGGRHRT